MKLQKSQHHTPRGSRSRSRYRAGWAALALATVMTAAGSAHAQGTVPVFVDGERLPANALLLRSVGRTLLPMRPLFESLGAQVEWDSRDRTVYAWKPDGSGVRISVGDPTAATMRMSARPGPGDWGTALDEVRLDAPAQMEQGRVFIPLRFAAEALKADVRYESFRPAVQITTGGQPSPEPGRRPRPDGPNRELRNLDLRLEVKEDRPRAGEPVDLVLVARNTGRRPLQLEFNSGQQFDFELVQEGRVVWQWSRDRVFTQALTSLELAAGEQRVFRVRWDGKNNNDRRVNPGRYTLRAYLTTMDDGPRATVEQQITLAR